MRRSVLFILILCILLILFLSRDILRPWWHTADSDITYAYQGFLKASGCPRNNIHHPGSLLALCSTINAYFQLPGNLSHEEALDFFYANPNRFVIPIRFIPLFFSLLLLVFIYLITLELTKSTVSGLSIVLLFGTLPKVNYFSTVAHPHIIATCFLFGATWAMLMALKTDKIRFWIFCGLFTGLATAEKVDCVFFFIVPAIVLLASRLIRDNSENNKLLNASHRLKWITAFYATGFTILLFLFWVSEFNPIIWSEFMFFQLSPGNKITGFYMFSLALKIKSVLWGWRWFTPIIIVAIINTVLLLRKRKKVIFIFSSVIILHILIEFIAPIRPYYILYSVILLGIIFIIDIYEEPENRPKRARVYNNIKLTVICMTVIISCVHLFTTIKEARNRYYVVSELTDWIEHQKAENTVKRDAKTYLTWNTSNRFSSWVFATGKYQKRLNGYHIYYIAHRYDAQQLRDKKPEFIVMDDTHKNRLEIIYADSAENVLSEWGYILRKTFRKGSFSKDLYQKKE